MVEIRTRWMRTFIWGGATLRGAVESAVRNGVSLKGADLRGIDLRKANLEGADLRIADLSEADLEAVNLKDADLGGAVLRGANLFNANLRRTNLVGANLTGCILPSYDSRENKSRGGFIARLKRLLGWEVRDDR